MKMCLLLAALLLVGCNDISVKPPSQAATVEMVDRVELKKLLRDCRVEQAPPGLNGQALEDVAINVANARKAALEECNRRLRRAREKLDER